MAPWSHKHGGRGLLKVVQLQKDEGWGWGSRVRPPEMGAWGYNTTVALSKEQEEEMPRKYWPTWGKGSWREGG